MPQPSRLSILWPILLSGCAATEPRVPLPPPANPRPGFYADVAGTASADGGPGSPWDLSTALRGGNGHVRPGDTVWVRAGTYGGSFPVTVGGVAGAPVVVRAWPGERAVIDGAGTSSSTLIIDADWITVWGLEITNSDGNRTTPRAESVLNNASHVAIVNLVVHDGGVGIYSGRHQHDVEISGCVIYDNGWQESDRGHGHGIYVKSDLGPVLVRGNVVFNQFGFGVHAFSDAGSGHINGVTIDGNASFDNGTLSSNSTSANVLAGGWDTADSLQVTGNIGWLAPGAGDVNAQVGWDTVMNGAMTTRGNVLAGGRHVLTLGYWHSAQVSGNTLIGDSVVQTQNDPDTAGAVWSGNAYFRDPAADGWLVGRQAYTFAAWRAATGLGATDSATAGGPAATQARVLADAHEAGRAFLVVMNWSRVATFGVDVSGVLAPGDSFEVRNVQHLFGNPVAAGRYAGGAIGLPLSGVDPPVPTGFSSSPAPRTGPLFDVFVLWRVSG